MRQARRAGRREEGTKRDQAKTGRSQKKSMVKRKLGIQKGKKHKKKRANMRGK